MLSHRRRTRNQEDNPRICGRVDTGLPHNLRTAPELFANLRRRHTNHCLLRCFRIPVDKRYTCVGPWSQTDPQDKIHTLLNPLGSETYRTHMACTLTAFLMRFYPVHNLYKYSCFRICRQNSLDMYPRRTVCLGHTTSSWYARGSKRTLWDRSYNSPDHCPS